MAGTPEEDLLEWLERAEEHVGFSELQDVLLIPFAEAQEMLYKQLGYVAEGSFEALKEASTLRYEELPSIGVSYKLVEHGWGRQSTYRDVITGRFVSGEDAFSLLNTIR